MHDGIIMAAQGLFGRHGLKKVTTDDIAREAQVSKATIYRLYRNKREILVDVIRLEMAEILRRISMAVDAEDTVEGRLRAHLLTKISSVHELVNLHSVTSDSMEEQWSHTRELRAEFVSEESDLLRRILEDGVSSGELQVPNPAATARFLIVSLSALEYPWAIEGLGVTVPQQVELMLRTLLDGLRTRETRGRKS